MMRKATLLLLLSLAAFSSACTTSTYGKSLQPISGVENEYTFKVYTGGFSGQKEADERAIPEIQVFMEQQGYQSYEIVSRRFSLIPSYYEYHIRFHDTTN
jgi:hypothetical protein